MDHAHENGVIKHALTNHRTFVKTIPNAIPFASLSRKKGIDISPKFTGTFAVLTRLTGSASSEFRLKS